MQAQTLAPTDPAIPHLLGVLLYQAGHAADGLALIDRAIALAPKVAPFHLNRANVLLALDRTPEGLAAAHAALAIDANLAPARAMLARAALTGGDNATAIAHYTILATSDPGDVQAWLGLALAKHAQGDAAGAIDDYRRVLALTPAEPMAINGLGAALLDLGRASEALGVLAPAAGIGWGPLIANLGNARRAMGDIDGAIAALKRAAELEPGNAITLANLGAILAERGEISAARAACLAAVKADPAHGPARSNLASAILDAGDAVAARQQWDAIDGDPIAGANALYARLFDPAIDRTQALAAARSWAARHFPGTPPAPVPRARDGRLRVGFVSPDFRSHSVAWFLLPYLGARAKDLVALYAYSELGVEDAITAKLKPGFDAWRTTIGQTAAAVAARIREDGIDVLVDLAGHTAGNRLDVFALRPAPVQASWLGYADPTGLAAIDWRLSDAICDPEPQTVPEAPWRLPSGIHTYALPDGAPIPVPNANTAPVFASFNIWPKHSAPCLALWAEILRELPDARLILKNRALADRAVAEAAHARLEQLGVARARVTLLSRLEDPRAHLALYNGIDVALDPFPYNGVTTTCEALAMGVPVVALLGARPAGRTAAALLTRAGHPEWIARDTNDYVRIALDLARDKDRRAALRNALRAELKASALGDAARFARDLDHAFESMVATREREKTAG
jgi:protein O-GlcNAc transferase